MSAETNYDIITDQIVRDALKADKGDVAQLVSFKVQDFTKKGDNYACIVTSIVVKYREGNVDLEKTYVAKIPHPRTKDSAPIVVEMMHLISVKEVTCYTEIVSQINKVLKENGLQELCFARCYATSLEENKEVLILEDLRTRGFKLYDRKRGIDSAHATLVLKEMGKLHAASLLLERTLATKNFNTTWPVLVDRFLFEEINNSLYSTLIESQMDGGAMIIDKVPNYEHVAKWLREMKGKVADIFKESFSSETGLAVLNHGDCWVNNILFRYDEAGAPVEVVLVDLQTMRKASAATDLNYFLHSSFNGPDRKENLKNFLKIYHDTFSSVLKTANVPVPFTSQELDQDFQSKRTYGCISGLFLIPIVLSEDEDTPEISVITEESLKEYSKKQQETVMRMSEKEDGLLRSRLLDMMDEMVEAGIIPK